MDKRLESLMDRLSTWPEEAQEKAARALAAIEEKHIGARRKLTREEEARLAALRETIDRSIARGGSLTDEDVEAGIAARLDAWERGRKDA